MWTSFEGEALIPWDQSALRWDQISVKLLSPALPVTSEFIDAGVSIISDIEIGSHAPPVSLVSPPDTPRRAILRRRLPGHAILGVDAQAQVLARSAMPCPCAATMAIVMVVSISPFTGASHATSNGRIRPEGWLRLDRLPATAKPAFFPCRQAAAFLAESKKAVRRRPPLRCGPDGCGPIAPRAKDRHRGCDWRGLTTDGDHHGYHRHLHRGG
jgi:hypothetical protein